MTGLLQDVRPSVRGDVVVIGVVKKAGVRALPTGTSLAYAVIETNGLGLVEWQEWDASEYRGPAEGDVGCFVVTGVGKPFGQVSRFQGQWIGVPNLHELRDALVVDAKRLAGAVNGRR